MIKNGQTPEEMLMKAIFRQKKIFLYPCIIAEERGEEKIITLQEAIRVALERLPLTKGKKDNEPWGRWKRIIELRFGLIDGKPKSRRKVGQDEKLGGIAGNRVYLIEENVLKKLRYPWYSRRLSEFIVPSSESLRQLKMKIIEMGEKGGESVEILAFRSPNNRVWSAVQSAGIDQVSELKILVETGGIRRFHNIGPKTEEFLKKVLAQEAPA